MKNVSEKIVDKVKTHVLYSNFFSKTVPITRYFFLIMSTLNMKCTGVLISP